MARPSPNADSSTVALGLAIQELRHRRGLTQEDLGDLANTHPTELSALENGVRNPTWNALRRISAALDLPTADVVALAEEIEQRMDNSELPSNRFA